MVPLLPARADGARTKACMLPGATNGCARLLRSCWLGLPAAPSYALMPRGTPAVPTRVNDGVMRPVEEAKDAICARHELGTSKGCQGLGFAFVMREFELV
jgi:hypothetical protein